MSPRTKAQNQRIRQDRENHILEVALELFAHQGYETTSISQIANKAGISKGLIYNYFASKEDVLKRMINHLDEMSDWYLSAIQDDDPRMMLRKMIGLYFDTLIENKEHWKLISELTFKVEQFDFIREFARDKLKAYHTLLNDLLGRIGIEQPQHEAKILAALFDGIGLQYLVAEPEYPIEELKDYLLKKYTL